MRAKFLRAGTIQELKSKGRLVVRGAHRPILVVEDQGRIYALDNRCPHMGFPLDRGSIEDGILTCHWHHARFDLASGCTFDLWADDVPTCAVELRGDDVWVQPEFGRSDAAAYWRQRLDEGMAHNLGLVIAKAIQGQLAAGVSPVEIVRQGALFGARNRDCWGTGMTILTAIGNGLAILPEPETYLALFHGIRRVAIDCDGKSPARQRSPLSSRPSPATLKRWLRRWVSVRHREAAERTVLTAIAIGAPPAVLADLLLAISVAAHTRHDTVSGTARAVLAAAPNRFALCGLSMGGYIAFEVMRQAPDRVERLALLDTFALPDTPEQSERRLTLIANAQSGEFKSVRDTLWPLLVHPARHDDVALKRAVFKMMDHTGPETFIRQQKAIISRPDSRPSLGMIHCPTLVLVGNDDALTPVSVALTIATESPSRSSRLHKIAAICRQSNGRMR